MIIAVGTFRQQAGDYWKQFVIRRIAFTPQSIGTLWGWLPGTEIPGLEGWKLTMEMVRSTMPNQTSSFTGISPISGNRDNYFDAYRAWRDVHHVACDWSFMPLTKDPEVFPGEVISSRHAVAMMSTQRCPSHISILNSRLLQVTISSL